MVRKVVKIGHAAVVSCVAKHIRRDQLRDVLFVNSRKVLLPSEQTV